MEGRGGEGIRGERRGGRREVGRGRGNGGRGGGGGGREEGGGEGEVPVTHNTLEQIYRGLQVRRKG